jgi:hypothetical protein
MLRHYVRPESPSMKNDLHQITRLWLGRFSFAFFVVAFFLGYEGYKRFNAMAGHPDWRTMLDFLAATLSVVLGMTGLRERHRPGAP